MYRMKQFSAMTGMTQSKIRFYEKHGLVLSNRTENGYRVFTPEDAFRSNAFRILLQYGFSINEAIEMLDEEQDTPRFRNALEEQRQRMERERDLLGYRLKRIRTALEFISSENEQSFEIVEGPSQLYVNASHGRDFTVANENAEILAEYYELLSVTGCARIIRRDDLLSSNPTVDPDYINTIAAQEEHYLSERSRARVKRLDPGTCVRFSRRVTREESVQKETFADLFVYLEENDLEIRDDILLFPSFLNLDGEGSDIEVLYVPVQEIKPNDDAVQNRQGTSPRNANGRA